MVARVFIVEASWLVRIPRTGPRRDARARVRGRGALLAAGGLLCLVGCGHSQRGVPASRVPPASGTSAAATKPSVPASPHLIRASPTPWKLPAAVYRTVAVGIGEQIFVLGGHDLAGGTINDVYELDAHTGASRTAGTLVLPTHGAAAAVLGGRILLFGGASTSVHDVVQAFDPVRGSARLIGHLPGVRADVTAAGA
jgi:Kelch motif